ncbi:hypothetical protein L1887_60784 [Cichorium endivia]|nr:hypothetical protein L1887_60784 [Cichorium endivia]
MLSCLECGFLLGSLDPAESVWKRFEPFVELSSTDRGALRAPGSVVAKLYCVYETEKRLYERKAERNLVRVEMRDEVYVCAGETCIWCLRDGRTNAMVIKQHPISQIPGSQGEEELAKRLFAGGSHMVLPNALPRGKCMSPCAVPKILPTGPG